MPTSNRIILTDVDGILLEWENHFTKWMISRGHELIPNHVPAYAMHTRFNLEENFVRKETREFNKSAWMGTQPPILDSQTWVKLLHAEGWTFIPITSQTSDKPAQELRKKRLEELFGTKTFQNYFIFETGASKDTALIEFHDTGLWWIEDKWTNALAGLKYGLKPLFYNHPYNQEYEHPNITRVNNWEQIYKIISGKK